MAYAYRLCLRAALHRDGGDGLEFRAEAQDLSRGLRRDSAGLEGQTRRVVEAGGRDGYTELVHVDSGHLLRLELSTGERDYSIVIVS